MPRPDRLADEPVNGEEPNNNTSILGQSMASERVLRDARELLRKKEEAEARIEILQQQLSELRNENENTRRQKNALEQHNETLRQKIQEDAKRSGSQIPYTVAFGIVVVLLAGPAYFIHKDMNKMTQTIELLEKENSNLQNEYKWMQKSTADLKIDLERKDKEIDRLRESTAKVVRRNELLEQESGKMRHEKEFLQMSVSDLKVNLAKEEKANSVLREGPNNMASTVSKLAKENGKLHHENARLNSQISEIKSQLLEKESALAKVLEKNQSETSLTEETETPEMMYNHVLKWVQDTDQCQVIFGTSIRPYGNHWKEWKKRTDVAVQKYELSGKPRLRITFSIESDGRQGVVQAEAQKNGESWHYVYVIAQTTSAPWYQHMLYDSRNTGQQARGWLW